MKIMATSDLHGHLKGLDPKGADVVVLAGDIAPLKRRGPWHINDEHYEIAYEPTWVEV